MKSSLSFILGLLLVGSLVIMPGTSLEAQILCTADGFTCPDGSVVYRDPDNECKFFPCPDACIDEYGAAGGLCNAYCDAMDCDGDPEASGKACARVRDNYIEHTGDMPPCGDCGGSFCATIRCLAGSLCDPCLKACVPIE